MGSFHATARVEAPPQAVFDALTDAARIADWFPGVRGVRHVRGPLDRVGSTYTLAFAWPVRAECTVVKVEGPFLHERTFVTRPPGSPGHARVRIRPDSEGSEVALEGDYALPLGAIGRAIDRLLMRVRHRRAAAEIAGLCAFVEARRAEAGLTRAQPRAGAGGVAATS